MACYVFDTSAIIALIDDEAGADTVWELLQLALKGEISVFVSILTVVELHYRLLRQKGEIFANQRLDELYQMPITVVDFTKIFAKQSAIYKSSGKLSFADACIASTAKQLNAILVHKDPEYGSLMDDVRQLALPFKPKQN